MMTDRPTIHVTNWQSRTLHGTARKFTIMATPRKWEHGDGRVVALTPRRDWVRKARVGTMTLDEYRAEYLNALHQRDLRPGSLVAIVTYFPTRATDTVLVADGDTLCCCCSRAQAKAGECHRVWAAEALWAQGWRVVLDGEVFEP